MITNFNELIEAAKRPEKARIAVAVAQDKHVLKAVKLAEELGLATAILVGDQQEIATLAAEINLDLSHHQLVDEPDKAAACLAAVKLVSDGQADVPMKGIVETSMILRAVLNKEVGLRKAGLLSHVGVFGLPTLDRLLLLSDSAMNIAPDVLAKGQIIDNTLEVALALGITQPKIALVCATETVNDKMPATLDAAELTRLNSEEGRFQPALVKGPLGLDNAISLAAAKSKGIEHAVAGQADAIIAPTIEAGNMLNKSLEYFAQAEKAGVIMGAKAPIILTSRASSDISKMNSIALALLIQKNSKVGQN